MVLLLTNGVSNLTLFCAYVFLIWLMATEIARQEFSDWVHWLGISVVLGQPIIDVVVGICLVLRG
ncbi:MAG: hypothetical protein ACI9HK_000913 [Pirellulaceae bacterium]